MSNRTPLKNPEVFTMLARLTKITGHRYTNQQIATAANVPLSTAGIWLGKATKDLDAQQDGDGVVDVNPSEVEKPQKKGRKRKAPAKAVDDDETTGASTGKPKKPSNAQKRQKTKDTNGVKEEDPGMAEVKNEDVA